MARVGLFLCIGRNGSVRNRRHGIDFLIITDHSLPQILCFLTEQVFSISMPWKPPILIIFEPTEDINETLHKRQPASLILNFQTIATPAQGTCKFGRPE
jgi:hypothetical protein